MSEFLLVVLVLVEVTLRNGGPIDRWLTSGPVQTNSVDWL